MRLLTQIVLISFVSIPIHRVRAALVPAALTCVTMLESEALEDRLVVRDRLRAAHLHALTLSEHGLARARAVAGPRDFPSWRTRVREVEVLANSLEDAVELDRLAPMLSRLDRAAREVRSLGDAKVLVRRTIVGRRKILEHLDRVERSLDTLTAEYARAEAGSGPMPRLELAPQETWVAARDLLTFSVAKGVMLVEAVVAADAWLHSSPAAALLHFALGGALFNSVVAPKALSFSNLVRQRWIRAGSLPPRAAVVTAAGETYRRHNRRMREWVDGPGRGALLYQGFTLELPVAYDEYPTGHRRRVVPTGAEIARHVLERKGLAAPIDPRRFEVDRVFRIDERAEDWTLTEFAREPIYPHESKILPF